MYKIFMIEDDEIVADIYKSKIEAEGYAVEVAYDGETGYDNLRTFKPDLLLLDMFLPKLSGLDVLQSLRSDQQFKDLPIIAFSGAGDMLAEATRRGATRVLSKAEFTPNQIVARITEVLAALPAVDRSKALVTRSLADWQSPKGRVFVVDDDPLILTIVKDVIEEEGYTVVTAQDGREAFKILEKKVDFVAGIFDVKIPYLEGTDLVRHMQTEKRLMKIPILIMTGEQGLNVQGDSFSAGAKLFIPKPFTRTTLRTMFRMLLAKKNTK